MSSKKRNRRPPPRKSSGQRQRPAAGAAKSAAGRGSTAGAGRGSTAGAGRGSTAGAGAQRRSFYTPGGSPFRRSVERRSAPVLLMLTQAPRYVVMFAPLVLVLLGFFLPLVYGLVALGIFFVLTGWLAYLSWPRADAKARLIRVAMFALVIVLVAIRISRA